MKIHRLIVPLLLLLATPICSIGQAPEVDYDALDKYYADMVGAWQIPSASIGIVKDGKLVFTGSYGNLEVGKDQAPDQHTLYAIASNSRAFTSAIIGMLLQRGKLFFDECFELLRIGQL